MFPRGEEEPTPALGLNWFVLTGPGTAEALHFGMRVQKHEAG